PKRAPSAFPIPPPPPVTTATFPSKSFTTHPLSALLLFGHLPEMAPPLRTHEDLYLLVPAERQIGAGLEVVVAGCARVAFEGGAAQGGELDDALELLEARLVDDRVAHMIPLSALRTGPLGPRSLLAGIP